MKQVLGRIILIRLAYWTGQACEAAFLMAMCVGGLPQIGSAASDIVSLHAECPYRTGIEAGLGIAAFTGTLSFTGFLRGYWHVGYQQAKSIGMPESIPWMNHQAHA